MRAVGDAWIKNGASGTWMRGGDDVRCDQQARRGRVGVNTTAAGGALMTTFFHHGRLALS
jgi:hypothetical protein